MMTDPFLIPYLPTIAWRNHYISQHERRITDNGRISLYDVADYHLFFGLHPFNSPVRSNSSLGSGIATEPSDRSGWIFREWAPNATAVYIIGMMTDWKIDERFRLFKRESTIEIDKSNPINRIVSGFYDHKPDIHDNGIWERVFSQNTFKHGDFYRLKIFWSSEVKESREGYKIEEGDRIPTCATRVVQDPKTLIFNAQVWNPQPESRYKFKCDGYVCSLKKPSREASGCSEDVSGCPEAVIRSNPDEPLLIYEAHTGMAQEEGKVGSFREFEEIILPRIKDAGYNAIQLMAVQEHPYYGSFGYHVSSFFAPSSRFGTPDDFKSLVDAAHKAGIRVIMDIVHSHAVSNEVEGLSRFDGTLTQFFHAGERGFHRLWGSRCFDYSKEMVVRFLLSNCRYWIEEYRVDGFRFDGITSMLYKDHGIGRSFTSYSDYFTEDGNQEYSGKYGNCSVDTDALSYLYLANRLIHQMLPSAVTIAEDVSGYPGLAAPQRCEYIKSEDVTIPDCKITETDQGTAPLEAISGTGFDYRFAMGVPDFWIKILKEYRDEDWPLGQLWYELNSRRDDERTISYAECHDQALVGDKTLMMRLMGAQIYSAMSIEYETGHTFRGVALHKMIRLVTLATAGDGYLNFMGNEFGHPEWIDFPGVHNNWSLHFARRQWSLRDNNMLYFSLLAEFDKDMIQLVKNHKFMGIKKAELLHIHEDNGIMAFQRKIRYEDIQDSLSCQNEKNRKNQKNYNRNGSEKTDDANLIFIFNFNPFTSFNDYMIDAPPGKYQEIMNSDNVKYGGKGRLASGQEHFTLHKCNELSAISDRLSLYLPTRTAVVLAKA